MQVKSSAIPTAFSTQTGPDRQELRPVSGFNNVTLTFLASPNSPDLPYVSPLLTRNTRSGSLPFDGVLASTNNISRRFSTPPPRRRSGRGPIHIRHDSNNFHLGNFQYDQEFPNEDKENGGLDVSGTTSMNGSDNWPLGP